MRRPLLALSATTLSALAAPAAADALVQIDRGIAGARLGNSQAEVRAALGRPSAVVRGRNDFGPYTEFRYRRAQIRVTFQGNLRVTAVSTTGRGDRTRRGVGVGSTEQAVKARVAGITCETFGGFRSCNTKQGLPGQRITAFSIEDGRVTRITVGRVID